MVGNNLDILKKCAFLRMKTVEEIASLFEQISFTIKAFGKNEMIVSEGEPADYLGILLSGVIELQKIYPSGKNVTVARFGQSETFGEAVLFSSARIFPVTVMSVEASKVMLIQREEMLKLFAFDADILSFFMQTMSDRVHILTQKIELLSLTTLRQKVAHFLIKESKKQKSNEFSFPFSVRVWAEHLSVPRPSLSRELAYMKDNGWLEVDGNHFKIRQPEALENLLL